MPLSKKNKNHLVKLGIVFNRDTGTHSFIYKKTGVGKTLPNFKRTALVTFTQNGEIEETYPSDCPHMIIDYTSTGFILTCWDWVPGPGPGDFEKTFTSEDEMVAFIESYYFGYNPYFDERKKHQEKQSS